jgi:hypothetical protein
VLFIVVYRHVRSIIAGFFSLRKQVVLEWAVSITLEKRENKMDRIEKMYLVMGY